MQPHISNLQIGFVIGLAVVLLSGAHRSDQGNSKCCNCQDVTQHYCTPASMAQSLADVNAKHFNSSAKSYDDKPHMVGLARLVAAAIQQRLALGPNTAVLEFGCGTGLISEQLAPLVGTMHGTDIATGMVEVYNSKASAKGLNNMRGVCVDILSAPNRKKAVSSEQLPDIFDVVLINMTAHHLDDVPAVLSSLGGLLAPGGKLVLTDLLATEQSKRFHGAHAHHSVAHHGGFSEASVRDMMQAAGLTLDSFDTDSLHITKSVQQPDGTEALEDFPVFMAIAAKS